MSISGPLTGAALFLGLAAAVSLLRATWPAPPARKGWGGRRPGHSRFYDDYIHNRVPAPDGVFWRDRRAGLLQANRIANGGLCQGGFVCGGRSFATQVDHAAQVAGYPNDYALLGRETPADVRCLCAPCHDYRTRLQHQGTNAYFHHWRTG